MESNRRGLCAGVVDELRGCREASHAGDCDDHTVVRGNHRWEKGAREAEVGEYIKGEDALQGGIGGGKDGEAIGETGVVDENCGGPVSGEDLLGNGGNGGRGS